MLPQPYTYLNTVGLLPRIVSEGLKEVGVKEVLGPGNNPIIMGWAKEVGEDEIGYKYTGDDVPWCGLFMAVLAKRAGKDIPAGPLYALNWSTFGTTVAHRKGLAVANPLVFADGMKASLGDVLVFKRPGGGHVGLYVGESKDSYHVLGGNQSDQVCFRELDKKRVVAIRRPRMTTPPTSMKPYLLNGSGKLSENEA